MMLVKKIRTAFDKVTKDAAQRKEDKNLFLCAAVNGSWGLVRELAERYPDAVRWRDETQATALHYAAFHKNPKMVHYLLDKGADIEAADKHGARPLHVAALCAGDYAAATLQALIGRGATLNAKNKLGATPLLQAALDGESANMRELVIAGADEYITNNTGYSARKIADEACKEQPQLSAAIEEGKAERRRRADEERRFVAEELRQSLIEEAVTSIANGLDGEISIMKPVRLAK